MPAYGTPEQAARRCGAEIARLRTRRNWSRAKLIARLYDELGPDDPNFDTISESWLKRLENGHVVKVPRQTIEALCRALQCTPREHARLLLYADRNGLVGAADPDQVSELLHYTMLRISADAHDILSSLIGQRRAADLDDQEYLELTKTALELVIAQQKKLSQR